MMMRRRLACCTRDRKISIDFDEHDSSNFPTGVMPYNGLKTCILNNQSYETESRISRDEEFPSNSLYGDGSSCSSKEPFGSLPSKWLTLKKGEHDEYTDGWDTSGRPQHFYVKEKIIYSIKPSDVETMKEKFAKLLLGEDATGGKNSLSSAFVLSNAITNLAVTVFGELLKLEPLPEERKSKWRREMDWLLSPTNYMVELVPAKQSGANGCSLEIMTPKARADIHMNLPALQMLDSMLIEALDSMVDNEFWYTEEGSQAQGMIKSERPSKRWWLPSPQVPRSGLSDGGRKKLMLQGRIIHQVLKAAKSINENVLLEMPVPNIIKDALPKSGRANLGDELYKVLTSEPNSPEVMLKSLNLKSEHDALNCINRLEAAEFAWKQKITGQMSGKSPMRTSWSFMKDPMSELDRTESLLDRAEALIQHIKYKYPNLPQTFLDATKIKYGKDVGHAILEAYSRVLGNVAFSILSRLRDILQEDILSNPNSPAVSCCFPGTRCSDFLESPGVSHRVRHSLINRMNKADRSFDPFTSSTSDTETSSSEPKTSSVATTPSRSRVWCIGKEGCVTGLPTSSP